jgi:hypothetical protein
MVMNTPVSGPSLFSVPFSTYYSFPSVELPMFELFVSLPAPYTALCQDEDGALASFDLYMEQCSGNNGKFLGLRWFRDQICYDGSCSFRAEFTVSVAFDYGAPMRMTLPETSDYIDQLVAEVLVLNLDQGIENSLDAKIAEAVGASDNVELAKYATTSTQKASANESARNRLGAFINAVNAQRGKAIPDAKADRLILLANNLAARL